MIQGFWKFVTRGGKGGVCYTLSYTGPTLTYTFNCGVCNSVVQHNGTAVVFGSVITNSSVYLRAVGRNVPATGRGNASCPTCLTYVILFVVQYVILVVRYTSSYSRIYPYYEGVVLYLV